MTGTVVERFWAKVDKSGDCWLWTGSTWSSNYGQFRFEGRMWSAHRVAWVLTGRDLPERMQLDHRDHCSTLCVRPDHLRLATAKQNQENKKGAYKNSKSGVRGVVWLGGRRRFRVKVTSDGNEILGGYFKTLDEAQAAAIVLRNSTFTFNDRDR